MVAVFGKFGADVMRLSPSIFSCLLVCTVPLSPAADPTSEIASFSSIKKIAVGDLASGNILAERGTPGQFDRGLAVQTCYLVRRPLDETADFLIHWNPTDRPELDVYVSKTFKTDDNPGFEDLRLDASIEPVRKLLEETRRAVDDDPRMNLSRTELELLRRVIPKEKAEDLEPKSPEFRKLAGSFWSSLLKQRVEAFRAGGITALPPYELGRSSIPIHGELITLLDEEPVVKARFEGFLKDALLHRTGVSPLEPNLFYWQLLKSERSASFCIGAVYARKTGNKWQIIDYQLFSSHDYLTMITVYELWPVTSSGADCTLVWREDFVSSQSFASLRGVEQMAAGALMIKSIKNNIRMFQEDANRLPSLVRSGDESGLSP